MRAVFTIDLPRDPESGYPEDDQIVQAVAAFGWDLVENGMKPGGATVAPNDAPASTNRNKYQELAKDLLSQMPEATAADEQNAVIFYGFLADDKTKFIITEG